MMNGMAYALITTDFALVGKVAHIIFRVHHHNQDMGSVMLLVQLHQLDLNIQFPPLDIN
jgi:hypothetical protein